MWLTPGNCVLEVQYVSDIKHVLPFKQVHGRRGDLGVQHGVPQQAALQVLAVRFHAELLRALALWRISDQSQRAAGQQRFVLWMQLWMRHHPEGGFGQRKEAVLIRTCLQPFQECGLGLLSEEQRRTEMFLLIHASFCQFIKTHTILAILWRFNDKASSESSDVFGGMHVLKKGAEGQRNKTTRPLCWLRNLKTSHPPGGLQGLYLKTNFYFLSSSWVFIFHAVFLSLWSSLPLASLFVCSSNFPFVSFWGPLLLIMMQTYTDLYKKSCHPYSLICKVNSFLPYSEIKPLILSHSFSGPCLMFGCY